MTFIPWPEIVAFHQIRKFVRVDPNEWFRAKEQMNGTSTVQYKAKVKLHGTNAAVQVHVDGTVTAQSRTNNITPENDNAGFARWVKANEDAWRKTVAVPTLWDDKPDHYLSVVIYGEWIGPGIQKGVAVSEIPKKSFAVFAMRFLDKEGNPMDHLMVEPERLALYGIQNVPDTYILPWYEKSIDINWRQTDEELTKNTAEINEWVLAIEANDPWVEKTFGVKGTGEGLVFYPVSKPHSGFEMFQNLCFKAKGEKHKNIATAKPAQVNPETAASIEAFVDLVLTPARLEQGATAVGGKDMKLTGKFVSWCLADVQKETTDELEASQLTWKDVQKPLSDRARTWYLEEAKK